MRERMGRIEAAREVADRIHRGILTLDETSNPHGYKFTTEPLFPTISGFAENMAMREASAIKASQHLEMLTAAGFTQAQLDGPHKTTKNDGTEAFYMGIFCEKNAASTQAMADIKAALAELRTPGRGVG